MRSQSRATTHGAGLLEQWLQNPLDEGYAETAARRRAALSGAQPDGSTPAAPDKTTPAAPDKTTPAAPDKTTPAAPDKTTPAATAPPPDRRAGLWTAAGCVLIGLVLVIAYQHAHRQAPTDARTRADLRARITEAQRNGDALEDTAQDLDRRIAARQATALGGSDTALTRAEAQAGTTAVRGPGVRVVLGNPSSISSAGATGRAGTTAIGAVSVLTDLDVRAVVNELWLDGAEAIAVNGIRLTPLSAIRFAGQAVLVDFQPVTSPYTIEAIGDSGRLITAFTDSAVADKYRTLASADGFDVRAEQVDAITMPANVISAPKYASTVPTGSPTPTPAPSAS